MIINLRTVLKASQDFESLPPEHLFRHPGIFFADVLFIPPEDICLPAQDGQVHVRDLPAETKG
jgi:hypothetical protein